jgi:cyanophycin synthetase
LEEKVGLYAAKASIAIAEALIAGKEYNLDADIQEMRELRESSRLGPSTQSIIDEAVSRDIPWIRLNKYSLCQLRIWCKSKKNSGCCNQSYKFHCIGIGL